ncbi:MAG: LysR substrate-binding domain-containing protein [Myxococcota bacterium]
MNFRQLQYFVAVAEERHFGRAARRLHISQPPLSQQIKALEDDLGVSLFARSTRRVSLTPAGDALLTRARGVLLEMEVARQEVQRVDRGEAGQVVVSFVGSATYALLPRLVERVRQVLPEVRLVIESERLSPEQEESLLAGRTDLAVLSLLDPGRASPLLEVERLRRMPLVVAMSRRHRLARRRQVHMQDLQGERFLMHPSQGQSILHQKVRELCHEAGFRPEVAQEVRETVTAVSLAAAGVGVAILPDAVRHLRITGAAYVTLEANSAFLEQVFAWRCNDRSPVLERVVGVAREVSVEEKGQPARRTMRGAAAGQD